MLRSRQLLVFGVFVWLFITSVSIAAPNISPRSGSIDSTQMPLSVERHVCLSGCPYPSVQSAVDAANPGDVIKVAAGTYTGLNARPRRDLDNTGVVTQVVYISKTVTIQGGYTTTNWVTSDLTANVTTLDAQGQGRVLYITGNISPTIEGLRLTGGNANGLGGFQNGGSAGGGVYVVSATATVNRNLIISNTAGYYGHGGGVHFDGVDGSSFTLTDNTIVGNIAGFGGGIVIRRSFGAVVSNNTIMANTAEERGGGMYLGTARFFNRLVAANMAEEHGSGLYLEGVVSMLSGNTFISNTAYSNGGGLELTGPATLSGNTFIFNTAYGNGGGLSLYYGNPNPILNGNIIMTNTAYGGGGLFLFESSATLNNNALVANTAKYGGGLYLEVSDAALSGNTVAGNSADDGGAEYLHLSSSTLVNNFITDNQANKLGSGLHIISYSSARLLHNTIARNTGGDGSGVCLDDNSVAAITNTILVSQTVAITATAGNTATLEGTLWGSGDWANTANWGGEGTIVTGAVNVLGDPAFVDSAAGNFHIKANSAARRAGVNAGVLTDIDQQPRHFQNPDIGADEYWSPGELKYAYLPIILKSY